MGADLFESYCGSLISALTLGVAVSEVSGVLFPLAIAGCGPVSYTHLRAHETDSYLVCRLLLEKKNTK